MPIKTVSQKSLLSYLSTFFKFDSNSDWFGTLWTCGRSQDRKSRTESEQESDPTDPTFVQVESKTTILYIYIYIYIYIYVYI